MALKEWISTNNFHLPYGDCRLNTLKSETEAFHRSNENQTTDNGDNVKHFPLSGPVFVACQNRGTALCQLRQPKSQQQYVTRRHGLVGLFYNDCVKLVPWSKTGPLRSFDVARNFTSHRFKLDEPLDPSTRCQYPAGHHHAQVSPFSILSPDDYVSSFIGSPSLSNSAATPLLSAVVRYLSSGASESGLLLAHIKRQMAGLYIAFCKDSITSEITLKSIDGKYLSFLVESVVARQDGNDTATMLHIFLPSTRITLLPALVESPPQLETVSSNILNVGGTEDDTTSPEKHTAISDTARLLIETVRCLRESSSKVPLSKTFILSGPPGVGKTFAVKQTYEKSRTEGLTLFHSLGSLLGSGVSPGDTALRLERLFKKSVKECNSKAGCVAILFIDECDALLSSEIVAGMFAFLLDQASQCQGGWDRLLVVAATNRIDSIPSYLRRPGRLDKNIYIGPPRASERASMLESLISSAAGMVAVPPSDVLIELAEACVGYVPADLAALVQRVFALALEKELELVNSDLFRQAMVDVGASALRDTSLSIRPGTTWDDIAGSSLAKTTLRHAIEWPITKREAFKHLALRPPKGILLYGPPGCAKTSLARAAASASGCAFLSLSPAEVYGSSYVGEAEATVRRAFALARSTTPCILFFDEIDSILGAERESNHGMSRSGGSSAESRVLSTFLNEMDGVDGSWEDGVLVLAATNRPNLLDRALLRPGRFDKNIFVPPPDYSGRVCILGMFCKAWNANVDIEYLASDEVTGSMTGAEIVGACRAAAMQAVRRSNAGEEDIEQVQIGQDDLEKSLKEVKPLLADSAYSDCFLKFQESC